MEYNFISPTNEIIEISNLSKFCKENDLDLSAMHRVTKGFQKHHKGFKLVSQDKQDENCLKIAALEEQVLSLQNQLLPILKEREKLQQRKLNEYADEPKPAQKFGTKKSDYS